MSIKEDYVSFETAKFLKDKGFDEYCPLWYNLDKPIEGPFFYKGIGWYGHNSYDYNGKRIVSALTLQMAMKWLREKHKLFIQVEFDPPKFSSDIYKMDEIDEYGSAKHIPPTFANTKSYEEAVEAAIKYCLENLI